MKKDIIDTLNKNNGVMKSRQLEDYGFSRTYISNAVDNGLIVREDRGIYVTKDVLKDEIYELGIVEKKTPIGMLVKTYDLEKTLCDIINNKDCMDLETRNKSIREIFQRDDFDIDKMYQYAKTMKIYDKVSNYVEVLL